MAWLGRRGVLVLGTRGVPGLTALPAMTWQASMLRVREIDYGATDFVALWCAKVNSIAARRLGRVRYNRLRGHDRQR
jgi:hypothetical protein